MWLDCYFSKYQGGFSNESVVSCVTIQFYLHPKYYFVLSMNYKMSSILMQHMLLFLHVFAMNAGFSIKVPRKYFKQEKTTPL